MTLIDAAAGFAPVPSTPPAPPTPRRRRPSPACRAALELAEAALSALRLIDAGTLPWTKGRRWGDRTARYRLLKARWECEDLVKALEGGW